VLIGGIKIEDQFVTRYYIYITFAILLLVSAWQIHENKISSDLIGIPKESIRLRILANSNQIYDQALKLMVRDAIINHIEKWLGDAEHLEDARNNLHKNLPHIKKLIGTTIKENGYSYNFHVELAEVPFPSKRYGNLTYPSGMYESLRIILGSGKGENWWCVLFPPLCFIDSITGKKANTVSALHDNSNIETNKESKKYSKKSSNRYVIDTSNKTENQIQVNQKTKKRKFVFRFYVWEKWKNWVFC
jgi:stage II sporulation protein R